jgi:hypothetical protein
MGAMSAPAPYPFERARDAFVEAYTLLDGLAASLTDERDPCASSSRP